MPTLDVCVVDGGERRDVGWGLYRTIKRYQLSRRRNILVFAIRSYRDVLSEFFLLFSQSLGLSDLLFVVWSDVLRTLMEEKARVAGLGVREIARLATAEAARATDMAVERGGQQCKRRGGLAA